VIVVSGMPFEARIAAGPDVNVVQAGHRHDLGDRIARAIRPGCLGLVSFGVAGGLDPVLKPGDCVVATGITGEGGLWPTDPHWSHRVTQMLPGSAAGVILGVTDPLLDPAVKQLVHRRTGAVAVDMESHIVARVAAAHRIPLLAIRVVTDPAQRIVPRSAVAALRADGSISILRMLRSLIAMPGDLRDLWQAMIDLRAARATLRDGRARLGHVFAHPHSDAHARPLEIAPRPGARAGVLADLRVMQRAE
jgi:hopanoid-associated phosphorylase